MADNSTGLAVKIVDAAGTNLAAVDASGRLSTNIGSYGGTATTLGQKAMAASMPVVLASDQASIPVTIAGNQAINAVQWGGVSVTAAAALVDNVANPTSPQIAAVLEGFDGSTYDRLRTTDATDGNAALTTTGVLDIGVGPGFARRFNPANLATAANSTSAVDVNGAGSLGVEIGTTTTGTFTFEVTVDGTTWVAALVYDIAALAFVTATNLTPTTGKVYVVSVNGMRQARLRTVTTLGATVAHVLTLSLGDLITTSPSGGTAGSVNLTQVGGSAIAIGQAAMAASLPVVIANNQSNIPENVVQWGGTNVLTGGVAGSVGVGGLAASGASKSGNPVQVGGVFNTTQPTVTTGQAVEAQATARGALIVATGVDAFTVAGTVSVTGVATAANQTNVQIVDNAAFADGTTTLLMAGYIFDETAGTALTENDAAAARVDSKRAQVFVLEDSTTRGQRQSVSAAGAAAANVTQVSGATQSATNPLFVRLTDGTTAYTAGSNAPVSPQFSTQTSAALGAGANIDLQTVDITTGKSGKLAGIDMTSTVPVKWTISTVSASTPTTRDIAFTQPYTTLQYRTPHQNYITQAGGTNNKFRANAKNMDSAVASDVYATFFWDEV